MVRHWDTSSIDEAERRLAYWDEQDRAWQVIQRAQLESYANLVAQIEQVSLKLRIATGEGRERQALTLSEVKDRKIQALQAHMSDYADTLRKRSDDLARASYALKSVGYDTI
jgi:hypothetical protein